MAEAKLHTQVLVVGAGPVGLTLAVDLGQRGVRCVLVERKDAPQFLPKMERSNARTVEIYRRMGVASEEGSGLPQGPPRSPMDLLGGVRISRPSGRIRFSRRSRRNSSRSAVVSPSLRSPASSSACFIQPLRILWATPAPEQSARRAGPSSV